MKISDVINKHNQEQEDWEKVVNLLDTYDFSLKDVDIIEPEKKKELIHIMKTNKQMFNIVATLYASETRSIFKSSSLSPYYILQAGIVWNQYEDTELTNAILKMQDPLQSETQEFFDYIHKFKNIKLYASRISGENFIKAIKVK